MTVRTIIGSLEKAHFVNETDREKFFKNPDTNFLLINRVVRISDGNDPDSWSNALSELAKCGNDLYRVSPTSKWERGNDIFERESKVV